MIFYNTHGATIRELCRGTEFPGMIDMAYRGCAITPAQYRQDCAGNGDLRGMSFTDAIKKKSLFGGVSWLLQQGNMNPQTASKWANLASFAALAFLILDKSIFGAGPYSLMALFVLLFINSSSVILTP